MRSSLDGIAAGDRTSGTGGNAHSPVAGSTPDPEAAAQFLERLRQESPSAFDRIASSPAALRCAINRVLLQPLSFRRRDAESRTAFCRPPIRAASIACFRRKIMAPGWPDHLGKERGGVPSAVDLARFRRRQLLRIVLRDVLGRGDSVGGHRGVVQPGRCDSRSGLPKIRAQCVARYGEPRLADGSLAAFR